ncbi:MAG: hypothetical protein E6J34_08380 [Chloroflexi bacterium]|nr:MAG: hypothetical protein E6J34_08380 [Chloroflexota bacterium]
MMISRSIEDLSWWQKAQPTTEELQLSGGLLVEDWPHARHVRHLSVELFDVTRSLHHLDESALHLLDRAAFLHNTGMVMGVRRHHKHSFRLINDTKLPDFTDDERYEIACIARYHRRSLPSKDHAEFAALDHHARRRVSILSALLRIADALDYNHDGRVLHIAAEPALCTEDLWAIRLLTRPLADLDEELEHAYAKADLFEKVFKYKLYCVVQAQERF